MQGGAFTSDLSRVYIDQAQAFPEIPRLTDNQTEALDMINDLSEELCYEHMIEPGDIQMLNNHVTYHGRTQYVDDACVGPRPVPSAPLAHDAGKPAPAQGSSVALEFGGIDEFEIVGHSTGYLRKKHRGG